MALDQLLGSFGQLLRLDAEMNCSKDFTPHLRLWSTARWGALNIEFSSPQTRRRQKLCSSPSGGTSTRSRWRLATRGSSPVLPASAALLAHKAHHLLIGRSLTER